MSDVHTSLKGCPSLLLSDCHRPPHFGFLVSKEVSCKKLWIQNFPPIPVLSKIEFDSQTIPFWATLGFVHFMVLFTSFSFTLKLSVTFLPLSASPPRLKSFLCSRIVFSFSTGTPFFRPVIVLFATHYLLPHRLKVSSKICQLVSAEVS